MEPNPESLKQILCLISEAEAAVKASHPTLPCNVPMNLGWFGSVVLRAAVVEPKFQLWTGAMEARFCLDLTASESYEYAYGNDLNSWQDVFKSRYCSAV